MIHNIYIYFLIFILCHVILAVSLWKPRNTTLCHNILLLKNMLLTIKSSWLFVRNKSVIFPFVGWLWPVNGQNKLFSCRDLNKYFIKFVFFYISLNILPSIYCVYFINISCVVLWMSYFPKLREREKKRISEK